MSGCEGTARVGAQGTKCASYAAAIGKLPSNGAILLCTTTKDETTGIQTVQAVMREGRTSTSVSFPAKHAGRYDQSIPDRKSCSCAGPLISFCGSLFVICRPSFLKYGHKQMSTRSTHRHTRLQAYIARYLTRRVGVPQGSQVCKLPRSAEP